AGGAGGGGGAAPPTPPPRQQQPRHQPYGGQAPPPPYGQQQWPPSGGQGAPHHAAPGYHGGGAYAAGSGCRGAGPDEPEYFTDPTPYPYPQGPSPGDPYANNPGHTQAFRVDEEPYSDGNAYRAGHAPAAPMGPRLHWKQLLSGIVTRPS
ncbi:YIP1 family protein, partial [Streptomyces sp. DT225]